MQILITHGMLARTRAIHLSRWTIAGILVALVALITLLSGSIYHFVFLKAAREGWPVVTPLIRLLAKDEFAQRDRFMRENLDAMAKQVGEMQAKLVRLEAMSERVAELAGLKKSNLIPAQADPLTTPADIPKKTAEGGPFVPDHGKSLHLPLKRLNSWADSVDKRADQSTDLLIMVESSLFGRCCKTSADRMNIRFSGES